MWALFFFLDLPSVRWVMHLKGQKSPPAPGTIEALYKRINHQLVPFVYENIKSLPVVQKLSIHSLWLPHHAK